MFESTDDLRIDQLKPLIPPAILMEELPVSEQASHTVAAGRRELDAILAGADDRLAVVVGPCSIHDPQAALEYGDKLRERAAALEPEPGFVDYLEVYALARAGARESARERLRRVSGDPDLVRWLERTFELQ